MEHISESEITLQQLRQGVTVENPTIGFQLTYLALCGDLSSKISVVVKHNDFYLPYKDIKGDYILTGLFFSDNLLRWYTEDLKLFKDQKVSILEFIQIFKLARTTLDHEKCNMTMGELHSKIEDSLAKSCIELENIYAFEWLIETGKNKKYWQYLVEYIPKSSSRFLIEVEKEFNWFMIYRELNEHSTMKDAVKLLSNGCGEFQNLFFGDLKYEQVIEECIKVTGQLELPIVSLFIQSPLVLELLEKYKDHIRVYTNTDRDLCDLKTFFSYKDNIKFTLKYLEQYDHFCGFGIRRYLEYIAY